MLFCFERFKASVCYFVCKWYIYIFHIKAKKISKYTVRIVHRKRDSLCRPLHFPSLHHPYVLQVHKLYFIISKNKINKNRFYIYEIFNSILILSKVDTSILNTPFSLWIQHIQPGFNLAHFIPTLKRTRAPHS